MKSYLRKSIIIIICFAVLLIFSTIFAQAKDIKRTSKKVTGVFTYRNCLNDCGIEHNHYIEYANVAIRNDCIQDYSCSECMDECAAELRNNNPEVYKALLDHTAREE